MRLLQTILSHDNVKGLLDKQEHLVSRSQPYRVIFKRYFLPDAATRRQLPSESGAVSYIIQPPLRNGTVGVWLLLATEVDGIEYHEDATIVSEGGRKHLFRSNITASGQDSEIQGNQILASYEQMLDQEGMTLEGNCVRTWFFVRDIDNNYAGLVKSRREFFEARGLTKDSHYIASTGIAGDAVQDDRLVQLDAYAITGDFSQRYLYAPTHFNPTHEYGVTFERGTRTDLGRLCCTWISGTASIDNHGRVVHIGDVEAQTGRMLENVSVLLQEAGQGWDDVGAILVYIRNSEDAGKVERIFNDRFNSTPFIILKAPVCRPDWLVEMECCAITYLDE